MLDVISLRNLEYCHTDAVQVAQLWKGVSAKN